MIVKVCGLTKPADAEVACDAGARAVGLVFFPPSPRNVTPSQAREISLATTPGVLKVGLFVDPSDDHLAEVLETVPLDMIQLHGKEAPERVLEVRRAQGLPVMKAVPLAERADLAALDAYATVADVVLCDAKAKPGELLPGGNGIAFDWTLLQERRWPGPWMLAGGLTPQNVARAVALTGASQVDVSSGVESTPGVKDPELIRAFIAAATGQTRESLCAPIN